ncbi:MAG: hypothetical protein ACREJO_03885 [Phycisphaerales bacterium]
MPPVIPGNERDVDGHLQLSFLDLIEIRLIEQFLEFGVGWRELRRTAKVGAEILGTSQPFARFEFRTDGRAIFAKVAEETGDKLLVQLSQRQSVFPEVIEPALRDVQFENGNSGIAARWWPLGQARRVVIDPTRSFGKPVGAESGVPAVLLARYARAHGTKAAAEWFEVDSREVRDSVTFVRRFAA